MNPLSRITQAWDQYKYETGKMSETERFINQFDHVDRDFVKNYITDLAKTSTIADPSQFFQKAAEFDAYAKSKGIYDSNRMNQYGYRSSGAKIWGYFPNPFGVFSYVTQMYPAATCSVNLIRTAIEEDGFYLVAADGVSKRKLYDTYERLKELEIDSLRVEMAVHEASFGNCWIWAIEDRVGLQELKLLYPSFLTPLFDRNTQLVTHWQYQQGRMKLLFGKDQLLHSKLPAMDNAEIGDPPLMAAITKIETSLKAQNLNNNIMEVGGLASHLVALKTPSSQNGSSATWVQQVQDHYDFIASGIKAGQRIIAQTDVEKVYPLTSIGELDANWTHGDERTDKLVAQLLGLPSEKIGIPRSASAQYQPELVENVVNAQFDSTINRLTRRTDRFLNRHVMRDKLKIYDIKIVPAGRYGALTLSAAQTVLILSQVGHMLTVNEAREKILGWEPLPPGDDRGQIVLNNSIVRKISGGQGAGDKLLPEVIAPELIDPELASEKVFLDKISSDQSLKMRIQHDDYSFYKGDKKVASRKVR